MTVDTDLPQDRAQGNPDAPRVIIHADMDAFFAAIEQRDHPEWRDRPVIVGGAQRREVVATCSYEARQFGVHSAMPGVEARRLCPQAVFVPPRMSVYRQVSEVVRSVFERFTPLVEPLSLDEAFLDVTGSQRLFGTGQQIAQRLKDEVHEATGLIVSVGVAPCKYVAKVASDLDKPDGLVCVGAAEVIAFLEPLPVARLWGAGRVTQQQFLAAGVRTLGDLQRLPHERLVGISGGNSAAHFQRLCMGDDPRPVVPESSIKSISHEMTFADDLRCRAECHRILLKLSEMVGRRLRQSGLRGRTVRLKARLGDFTTFTRQTTSDPQDATANDLVIYQQVKRLFDQLWSGDAGIRLLGVGVSDWAAAGLLRQGDLFESSATTDSDQVLGVLDELRDRFGSGVVYHGGVGRGVGGQSEEANRPGNEASS
jgi:DNA polymerase IV